MKNNKKICFIFAWPIRTNPILITMPFALNIIEILDKKGYKIDIYLSEYSNKSYVNIFSKNVTLYFLDHNYLWPKEGILSFLSITNYFRQFSLFKLRNKYSYIFAGGMAGITLGRILKKYNIQSQLIYLNDEFPIQGKIDVWVKNEIISAQKADVVVIPEEYRFTPLCKQIPNLDKKPHFTLPNVPLIDASKNLPQINWHEYFQIDKSKKIFLMAGGLQDFNKIDELVASTVLWPENTVLIVKGKNDVNGFIERFKSIINNGQIIFSSESFTPDELHSLISYSTASFCLYEPINENLEFVGKSSGKLMRSILLGKPVIVSKSEAFNFVTDYNFGIQVSNNIEIAQAVDNILKNDSSFNKSCNQNYSSVSFEYYWEKFEDYLFNEKLKNS